MATAKKEAPKKEVEIIEEIITPTILSETDFLKHLLHLQDIGGWGKHLHPIIEKRIKEITNG